MCFGCFSHMFFDELCCFVWFMRLPCCLFYLFFWQPHKPHKTTQLIKKHMRKQPKHMGTTGIHPNQKREIGITKAAASVEKTV
jgi:hypothetical protein